MVLVLILTGFGTPLQVFKLFWYQSAALFQAAEKAASGVGPSERPFTLRSSNSANEPN